MVRSPLVIYEEVSIIEYRIMIAKVIDLNQFIVAVLMYYVKSGET